MNEKLKQISRKPAFQFAIVLLLFTVYVIYSLSPVSFDYDMLWFRDWISFAYQNGIQNVYNSQTDYLPLYHYFGYVFAHICGSVEAINGHIKYIKLIPFIFHLADAVLFFAIIRNHVKMKNLIFTSLFYLLNVAVLFNTLVWGQVDEIETFFVLLSMYLALKNKITWSFAAYVLAINFKFQAIIFLPLLAFIWIENYPKYGLKKWVMAVLTALSVQLLIYLPFILSGNLNAVFNVIKNYTRTYPCVSQGAFNFWHFFFHYDSSSVSDKDLFLGINYNHWGYVLFLLFSFIVLFPWMKAVVLKLFKKQEVSYPDSFKYLSFGLIAIVFFYFNTQMHERYSHPGIIFVLIFSVMERKYWISILFCLAYLFNLHAISYESTNTYLPITIHDDIAIAIMYALVLLGGTGYLHGKLKGNPLAKA